MKKIFGGLAIAALGIGGICFSEEMVEKDQLPYTLMANVEALTSTDSSDRVYAERKVKTLETWDDEQGIHQSLTVIDCEGKGNIICP